MSGLLQLKLNNPDGNEVEITPDFAGRIDTLAVDGSDIANQEIKGVRYIFY